MTTSVTGAAGFIGFHLSKKLAEGHEDVVGISDFDNCYGVVLKHARSKPFEPYLNFRFQKLGVVDKEAIAKLFAAVAPDVVINFESQAEVCYSREPVGLMSFIEILECQLWKKVEKIFLPLRVSDGPAAYAVVDTLVTEVGFKLKYVEEGLTGVVDWCVTHGIKSNRFLLMLW